MSKIGKKERQGSSMVKPAKKKAKKAKPVGYMVQGREFKRQTKGQDVLWQPWSNISIHKTKKQAVKAYKEISERDYFGSFRIKKLGGRK